MKTFPRRGPAIRILFHLLCLPLLAASWVAADPVVVLLDSHRREVEPMTRASALLLPLDAVITGLGVTVHTDVPAGSVTLGLEGRELVLYNNKSLASVAGELRLLSSPCYFEGGRWLVPVDGLPRLLGYLLARPVEWRASTRVLLVGTVKIPHIDVAAFASGESVRVVLAPSEKLAFRVKQGEGRVTIDIERDIVEVKLEQEKVSGGIVDSLEYTPGRNSALTVMLGKRFQQLKASEQENPPRLILDFLAAPSAHTADTGATPAATAATPAPTAGTKTAERVGHSVVIDAGHGGAEVGAQGGGGTLEKDVTLAIARRLRTAIVNNLGYQVFMTREKDEEVPLDQRTAIANNFKADVFVSIHVNASRAVAAHGSEVYFLAYQASDAEAHKLAMQEGAVPAPEATGIVAPGSDLQLILWDMAQAEHLEESSALAARIHEELAEETGSASRGVKQAPFRVLVGATMPAVLVEVAFLSNAEEEKQLTSEGFQSRVANAIMRGMSRYFQHLGQRPVASR
jgi:N-acetylmuramoyl-L-alanine amidase